MNSPDESTSKLKSERGEVVIPVREYVDGDSLAQEELNTEVRRLLVLGVRRFALDFKRVAQIDSAGIGVFVQAITLINHKAGEWRIINLPPRVKDVLNITGLF